VFSDYSTDISQSNLIKMVGRKFSLRRKKSANSLKPRKKSNLLCCFMSGRFEKVLIQFIIITTVQVLRDMTMTYLVS